MKERRYNLSVRRFLAWVIAIAVAVSILTVPQTESYAAGGKIKTIAVTNLPAKQLTLKKGKSFTLKTKVTATFLEIFPVAVTFKSEAKRS